MATQKRFQAKNGLDNNTKTITGVANPVNAQDAATKDFSSNASNLTAGTLSAARLPAFTGDASVAAGTSTITLSNSGATAGTYKSVTVDAKGRVTAGTNPTTLAGYGITDALQNGGSYGTVTFSNWVRTSGDTGWYSETYGGGMHMTDTTWVRVYNGKNFYTAGEGAFGSNVTAYYSDERLKEVIEELDPEFCLDAVNRWRKVRYHANDLGAKYGYDPRKLEVGLLAGEVNKDFPELTPLAPFDYETLEDGSIVSKSGENYKTMTYERVVAVQAAAITALTRRLEKLEGKLNV